VKLPAYSRLSNDARKGFVMKRLQRFSNMRPDDAKQEEWYWDRNVLEEDLTCHAKRTDCPASKSKVKAKKAQNRLIRNKEEDDAYED
jgi:hypothetical protein